MAKSRAQLDQLFHALSDPTRRAVIERLAHAPASVSSLAAPFGVSLPTMLEHLRVLERADVVTSVKFGRVRTFQLRPDAFAPAIHWLDRHRLRAERELDRLGDHLAGAPVAT